MLLILLRDWLRPSLPLTFAQACSLTAIVVVVVVHFGQVVKNLDIQEPFSVRRVVESQGRRSSHSHAACPLSHAEAVAHAGPPHHSLNHSGALFSLELRVARRYQESSRIVGRHVPSCPLPPSPPLPSPPLPFPSLPFPSLPFPPSHYELNDSSCCCDQILLSTPETAQREAQWLFKKVCRLFASRESCGQIFLFSASMWRPLACESCGANWLLQVVRFVRTRTNSFIRVCPRAASRTHVHSLLQ